MLTYAHANRKGTGSRLTVTMFPASGESDGFVRFNLTNQENRELREGERARFEDSDYVEVDLDAKKVAHVIGVLWGDGNSILGGKGLRVPISNDGETVAFYLDAVTKPFEGFAIHMVETYGDRRTGEGRILLNCAEARALCSAIESSMGKIAFGK